MRDAARAPGAGRRRDALAAVVLAFLGVGSRLEFLSLFPARPISDWLNLVAFGRVFHDRGLFPHTNYWTNFNPGLPMILSLLDGIFPQEAGVIARTATAIATGLLGLIPFLLWRPVLAFRWRLLGGLLLALWPGQVFFSGIALQDNWVLLPGIALCALAVRRLRSEGGGYPVVAGLLFAVAVAIRQEMVLALLPPLLAAAGMGRSSPEIRRNFLPMAMAAGIPILALAAQRYQATGRFTITTEHGGLAFLGAFAPGSFTTGWTNPRDYLSEVDPTLFADPVRMRTACYRLAWEEAKRHPVFHALRIIGEVPHLALVSDAENLTWAVSLRGALPDPSKAAGERFRWRWDPRLKVELGVIQGLFVATLLLGIWKRDRGILVIAAAIFLKVSVHLLMSPMCRLVLPAIAFELLAIPLGAAALGGVSRKRRYALGALVAATPILLLFLVPPMERKFMTTKLDEPKVTRFSLAIGGMGPAECVLDRGKLICLDPGEARIETDNVDPAPGEAARALCRLPPLAEGEPLMLRLGDAYSPGGWPDRMIARVFVDGRQILRYDVAKEPGSGWLDVPLVKPGDPVPSTVTIEEVAIRPELGMSWGPSAPLGFAFRR